MHSSSVVRQDIATNYACAYMCVRAYMCSCVRACVRAYGSISGHELLSHKLLSFKYKQEPSYIFLAQ